MKLGTLYSSGHLCPFSHRVLIASRELRAPLEAVYTTDVPAEIRAAVPDGGWPVFLRCDGGGLIMESGDVVEYLILHSGDVGSQFRSEMKVLGAIDDLVDSIRKVIMAGKLQQAFRHKLDSALAKVDELLTESGGPFLGGDRFSQADCYAAPFLHRMPFMVEIRNHVPEILLHENRLTTWIDLAVNRPSFQDIAPKRHALRQFYAENAEYGKPMKIGRLHHSGFRGMWADLAARTSATGPGNDRDNRALQEARDLCLLLFRAVALHAKFENLVLFPALDAATKDSEFTADGLEQHQHEVGGMNALLDLFDQALGQNPGSRQNTLSLLATETERIMYGQFAHLEYEEATFMPVLAELDVGLHLEMLKGAYEMCILERPHLIGVLTSYMPIENTLSLLDSLLCAVTPDSEQWRLLLTEVHAYLTAEQWLWVGRRFEDALPTSLLVAPAGTRHGCFSDAVHALQAAAPVGKIMIPSSV